MPQSFLWGGLIMDTIVIFILLITVIIVITVIWKFHHAPNVVIGTIVVAIIIIASSFYLTSTEGGKRFIKDFTSDVSGGIPRHVKVYDINGELIEEYKGTFDIETTNDNYILFDDENNLRHIIYFTTGTVIIDELGQ